ncbi:hypothetical protein ABT040_40065 [Streptomyces sp. NPDC002688]|uniref:hypothetical protein n=1 Tax=Streptomyces sp. NPDC002688 TaxID=3154423 RepID=UPI0033298C87
MGRVVDERHAMALLCARLGRLRELADAGGWLRRLDLQIAAVRDGDPAASLVERLGLLRILDDVRAGSGSAATTELWGQVELTGDYVCPRGRCARRGRRDARGSEPMCQLAELQMAFVTAIE